MKVKVNINIMATVTLTPHGRDVLRRAWASVVAHDEKIPGLTPLTNEYRAPLWDLMQTFGASIYMGGPISFVNNEVTLHPEPA